MDLFVVNRYTTELKQNDPDKLFENLQKNIEKKKKKQKKIKDVLEAETVLINEIDETIIAEDAPEITTITEEEEKPIADENDPSTLESIAKPAILGEGFTILGDESFQKKKQVQMVLPNWLAYPTVISNDLSQAGQLVEEMDYLNDKIKKNLKDSGVKSLFPVQSQVIPWIINTHSKPTPFWPRDICVSAPTGSGKTLAFAVPIVQLLLNRVERKVRALVVLPVQELATQVAKVFKDICKGTDITSILLSRNLSLIEEQKFLVEVNKFSGEYRSKVDIVVTTAGRLVEHIHSTKGFSLKGLKFLVIDEADRVMEQIQNDWLYHLNNHVKEESDAFLSGRSIPLCVSELWNETSRQPHKLLFSATLSQDPEKLQNLRLFQPKLFTSIVRRFDEKSLISKDSDLIENDNRGEFIGKYTTPAELIEKYCITQPQLRPLTLYTLIKENKWNRFLCFTNSAEAAHRLSFVLQKLFGDEMIIEELSSALNSTVRQNVLTKFEMGKVNGLISSDALARGIDLPDIEVVISYDPPRHPKTYIHRVGRTARAGKMGTAISLLTETELLRFNKIIESAGKDSMKEMDITTNMDETNAKRYTEILKELQLALEKEKQYNVMRSIQEKSKFDDKNKNKSVNDKKSLQVKVPETKSVDSVSEHLPQSWRAEILSANIKIKKSKKNISRKRKLST